VKVVVEVVVVPVVPVVVAVVVVVVVGSGRTVVMSASGTIVPENGNF
jgi:hypothetical protein